MKAKTATAIGIFCVLSASPVFANPEPDAMRTLSAAQDAPIPVQPPSEHVVSPGDTLDKIARLHGCRVSSLLEANGLKADAIIHPGQKIKLPTKDQAAPLPPAPTAPDSAQPAQATHTVAAGDTFAAIARQHDIPLNDLLAANPDIKPTALRPGQKVCLPSQSVPSNQPSLETGNTQMILATKDESANTTAPLASPPTVKILPVKIDREMTYHEFASRQGTNTRRLNQLNGLDLLDSALLAKGSELLAPAQP